MEKDGVNKKRQDYEHFGIQMTRQKTTTATKKKRRCDCWATENYESSHRLKVLSHPGKQANDFLVI